MSDRMEAVMDEEACEAMEMSKEELLARWARGSEAAVDRIRTSEILVPEASTWFRTSTDSTATEHPARKTSSGSTVRWVEPLILADA